jgi:hypothetical protein
MNDEHPRNSKKMSVKGGLGRAAPRPAPSDADAATSFHALPASLPRYRGHRRPLAATGGWFASEQTAARTTRSAKCKRTETHRRRKSSARTTCTPCVRSDRPRTHNAHCWLFHVGPSPVPLGGLGSAGNRGAHRHLASSCYRLSPRPTARSPPPLIAAVWSGPPRCLLTWRLPAQTSRARAKPS